MVYGFMVKTDNTAYQALVLVWLGCGNSYAKIWGETKFQCRVYPQSWSKAMSIEERKKKERKKERKRAKVSDNNSQ